MSTQKIKGDDDMNLCNLPGKNKVSNCVNSSLLFEKLLEVNDFNDSSKKKNMNTLTGHLQPKSDFMKAYREKMENLSLSLEKSGYEVKNQIYKNTSPLVIGMGRSNVIENGMTFNRNWGIPIIPASAIKGVVRNYVLFQKGDEEKLIQKYLGSDDDQNPSSGEIYFLDAYITNTTNPVYKVDIINNHFQPYYEKGEAPNDWFNPNPVFFMVLNSNQKFTFTAFGKNEEALDKVSEWLEEALLINGIGGKTAVGYGRLKLDLRGSKELISEKQEELEKEKMKSMTPLERLLYEIEKEPNFDKSLELFNMISSIENEQEKIECTKKLKEIWIKIGKWNGKQSKKQKDKIKKIKEILKEN